MNFRYPVFLDIRGKRCLVVGEGYEIPAKVQALVDAEADVLYINPSADYRIAALATSGAIQWERREFAPADLDSCFLVISQQDDNSEIFKFSEERNILCNSVDDPEHCRFSFGSVHRQRDLTVAISTNGWAPALAVRLKEKLQSEIGPEYGQFLSLLREVRPEITSRIHDFAKRRDLWYRIVDSAILDLLQTGNQQRAHELLRELIEQAVQTQSSDG